jgi:hypothetical protein
MTSQEPVNIQRLVRQNDVYAKAEAYSRTVTVGTLVGEANTSSQGNCLPAVCSSRC